MSIFPSNSLPCEDPGAEKMQNNKYSMEIGLIGTLKRMISGMKVNKNHIRSFEHLLIFLEP